MTPLETIQAARALLATLREQTTPGPWEVKGVELVRDAGGLKTVQDLWVADIDPVHGDAALIVTLAHPDVLDAIDAQLESDETGLSMPYPEVFRASRHTLAIATALLAAHPEGDK